MSNPCAVPISSLLFHHVFLIVQAERGRKNAENELSETSSRLSEVTLQVTTLTNDKRRLEGDLTAMQSDLDDAINAQRAAEVSTEKKER